MQITRLAPSPTGALHLGNARTFLITYLLARQRQWKIALRIEDIDGPRIKTGAARQAIDDLIWMGISWDIGPVYQSQNLSAYREAAMALLAAGNAYPCTCSRSEIDSAASAPHAADGATPYPGTCRGRFKTPEAALAATGRRPCIRFRMPDRSFTFHDGFKGTLQIDGVSLGDFPILKADHTPAYQLACALDDVNSGITEVVRGDDLLDSTPRQLALIEALNLADRTPHYTHLPLVIGPDGKRLAKRHGDTRLASYRDRDGHPEVVLTLLARWCGISAAEPPTCADELIPGFDLRQVPHAPIVMLPTDHPA